MLHTCCEFVSVGIKDLSMFCTVLSELDISGCWQITDKSLYALQENLVHMRGENTSNFSLTVGGQLVVVYYINFDDQSIPIFRD